MKRIEVTCTGITPLLMNKLGEEILLGLLLGPTGKGSKTKERPATPRDAAMKKVYQRSNGTLYLPVKNLFACLVQAGTFVRLEKSKQISTATKTLLPAFITLAGMEMDLHNKGVVLKEWEVDLQGGRNPNGGEAVCICRPRIDAWGFTIEFDLDNNEIDEATIRKLWDFAGSRVGLGDFRPARKGQYGQFRVDVWKDITVSVAAE